MNDITIFQNPEFGTVRTLLIDGEPYFVGKDVADILGYTNSRKALIDHVDDEDKNTVTIRDGIPGNPNQVVINESGLFSLILSSKLPAARRFKHWVTSEVLPAIRKYGMYVEDDMLENPDRWIRALEAYKAERLKNRKLTETVAIQTQQIAEMQPKATYYDLVLSCADALPISIIAKDYGWSAKRMNQFLHDKGVQYKVRKTWVLYAGHAEKGYTKSETFPYIDSEGETHTAINTKWTQKGQLFIYDLMSAEGYLPLVEQGDGCANHRIEGRHAFENGAHAFENGAFA